MSESIVFQTTTELLKKIKAKEISCVELLSSFLEQIEKHNLQVNAIFDMRKREDLLKEALEKDIQISNNDILGPLHGIPITIKDSFLVKGLKTSNGDPFLKNNIADENSEVVEKLKNAGAIIIGKTNVPLYCIDWQTTNSWNGQTNNPYDFSRVAGGSSGGSAAAIASGFSSLELGADAGGSIRVPAHFCGICGLRPTEYLLSNHGHLKYPNKPLGRRHVVVPGPLGKSISDLILMMEVLTGNSNEFDTKIPNMIFNQGAWNGEKMNIAVSESINNIEVDKEYLEVFKNFIEKIRTENHKITEDNPTYDEKTAYLECSKIIGYEIGVNNPKVPFLSTYMYLFILLKYKDHLWAKGMALGQRLSNTSYAKSLDYKNKIERIYSEFLDCYDVWITPVCSIEAFKHQKAGKPFFVNGVKVPYTKAIASFTFTTAFSGHPIVVIPIGKKSNGMPLGVQIHSKKWSDKKLLQIAKYFETFTTGFEAPKLADKTI